MAASQRLLVAPIEGASDSIVALRVIEARPGEGRVCVRSDVHAAIRVCHVILLCRVLQATILVIEGAGSLPTAANGDEDDGQPDASR
jgi:hypothetical protein